MNLLLIHYPKCSTCQNARRYLSDNNIQFTERDITKDIPTVEELKLWHKESGYDLHQFFNKKGTVYRELGLKDKIDNMSLEEMYALLSTDGKLIKRPLLIMKDDIIIGFKKEEYATLIK